MKTTLSALLCFVLFSVGELQAQTCSPPHQSSCDPNANYCSPAPLSSITCRPFRFTGLEGYWSFAGDGSTVTIRVTPNICFAGPPPGDGIAAQLLEDCVPVTALPPPSHNLTDIVFRTEPCKVYTLYVVKVAGCSCDEITINVSAAGGSGPPTIPRPIALDIDGELCVCNDIEICADISSPCNLYYQWEINGAPRPDLSDLECIDYSITSTAPVTICLTAILGSETIKCDEVKQCTTITPYALPPVNEPLEVVCWEDHLGTGYLWQGKFILNSCINPPCSTRLQDRDGCCYELFQPILLRPRPTTPIKSVILCDSTELPYVTEDGQKWNEAICNELIMFEEPKYRCDTAYALTVSVLDPKAIFGRICDNPNELILTVDADLDIACPVGIVTYELEWIDCNTGDVISMDTFLRVTMPGSYCLNMIVSFTNIDGTMGECIKELNRYEITPDDFGQISVDIGGDTLICEGLNGFYEAIPNNGITAYNWSITSSNGTILTPNPSSSSTIEVDWSIAPGDSGVLCLEANEDCVSGDTCIVIRIIDRPNPSVMSDTSVCGSGIDLFGSSSTAGGSWSVTNSVMNVQFEDPSNINSSVTIDSFGTYTFIWSEGPDNCQGSDSVVVVFNELPDVQLVDTICDPEGMYYLVTLQVNGGAPGYTISFGGGDIDSSGLYQSDTILKGDELIVTFTDSIGCEISYNLKHQCDCGLIEAGTIDNMPDSACIDECITVIGNGDHVIEADQCVFMILHRDSTLNSADPYADTLVTQVFDPSGNEFCFDPNTMVEGTTYYVHYLVTRCNGGEADLDFACLQYVTKSLVFLGYPSPDLGPDLMLCGLDTFLSTSLTIGQEGTWQRISGPGNAIFGSTLPVTPLTVDTYGEHVFVWTENNFGCSTSDTIRIRFLDAPLFQDWAFECDSLQQNFRIIVRSIAGGDSTSYDVGGNTIGGGSWNASFNGMDWTSPWFAAGDSIHLTVQDQYGCAIDILRLKHECECSTELGQLTLSPNEFCGPDGVTTGDYQGGQKGVSDIVVYYLHSGTIGQIANIIDFNSSGVFGFDPNTMQLNQRYFVTVRVGIDDGTGQVNPDYECLIETPGQLVVWYDTPKASLIPSLDSFYCNTASIILDGSSSVQGADVGQLNYEWSSGSIVGNDPTYEANAPGTYLLTITNDSTGCIDSIDVTLNEVPGPDQMALQLTQPECDGPSEGRAEVIMVEGGRGPFQYQLDDGSPVGAADFGNLEGGVHTIKVIDKNGCESDTTFEIFDITEIEVLAKDDQYLNEGESIDLDSLVRSLQGDTVNARLIWVNENGDSIPINSNRTLLDSLVNAQNTFQLIAISEAGCISIDYITIFIRELSSDIYIPNVISPNGDNINDDFRIYVSSDKIDHIDKLRIFTRWGELIYENSEIIKFDGSGVSVSGWDGTFQGERMNPGVYVYTVEVVDLNASRQLFAGSVTIIE